MTKLADETMSGRVAYLVMAHAADEQLRLLVNELLSDSRSTVYLHLDAKVFLLDWIEVYGASRLVVLPNRIAVNWGGYSVVEATLRLLDAALSDTRNAQFALLSGSCFPMKPTCEINDDILALNKPSLALWGRVDPELRQNEGLGRYVITKFHPHDRAILTPKNSLVHERVWKVYKKLNARLPYERKVDVTDIWKGSQFFIVDRKYAEICACPPVALVKALRYALAPDEILFTTLIVRHGKSIGEAFPVTPSEAARQASHFIIKRVPPKRTFRDRLFRQIDLRQLGVTDADDAVSSGALFARKCSAAVSVAIAERWTSKYPVEVRSGRMPPLVEAALV